MASEANANDPLELLRGSIASNSLPQLRDDSSNSVESLQQASNLRFASSSVSIPVSTPTRFTTDSEAQEVFTVQQVYYVYLARDAAPAEYIRNAGFRPVGLLDRRLVLDYLTGGKAPERRIIALGTKLQDKIFEGEGFAGTGLPDSSVRLDVGSSAATATAAAGAVPKRKYEPNLADFEAVKKIRAQEIALLDKYDTLRVTFGGKKTDFTALRKAISEERIQPLRESIRGTSSNKGTSKGGPSGSGSSKPQTSSSDPNRAKKQRSTQRNIIILSSSPTALVSMWNVKRFLEDGVYERTEEARQRQVALGNRKMEDVIVLYRTTKGPDGEDRKVKYYAIDNVDVLNKLAGAAGNDPWERVVSVFTTGQEWQFKNYKWTRAQDLFRHVRGIYMHFSNQPVHPAIADWKVTIFALSGTSSSLLDVKSEASMSLFLNDTGIAHGREMLNDCLSGRGIPELRKI